MQSMWPCLAAPRLSHVLLQNHPLAHDPLLHAGTMQRTTLQGMQPYLTGICNFDSGYGNIQLLTGSGVLAVLHCLFSER